MGWISRRKILSQDRQEHRYLSQGISNMTFISITDVKFRQKWGFVIFATRWRTGAIWWFYMSSESGSETTRRRWKIRERIAFGKEYFNSKEWKFIWKVFNKEVSNCKRFILLEIIVSDHDNLDREEYGQKNTRIKWSSRPSQSISLSQSQLIPYQISRLATLKEHSHWRQLQQVIFYCWLFYSSNSVIR